MNVPDTEPAPPSPAESPEASSDEARGFLGRWSRRKQAVARGETPPEPAPAVPSPAVPPSPEAPLPDPLTLGMADDFSAFLRDKVPPALKHKAMQHLFSHPHFNELDMMDVYMEDFNLVPNLEPAALDLVKHAKAVLSPEALQPLEGDAGRDATAASGDDGMVALVPAEDTERLQSPSNPVEDDPPAVDEGSA